MNKSFLKALALITVAVSMSLISSERVAGRVDFRNEKLRFHNVSFASKAKQTFYSISDLSYSSKTIPAMTECVIPFNNSSARTDETGRYKFSKSVFTHKKADGSLGGGSAYFYRRQDSVSLSNGPGLWMSNSNDLGEFSIEFRFRADSLRDGGKLFSRVGYFSGVKNGIDIQIVSGRIQTSFYGVFTAPNGIRSDAKLRPTPRLKTGQWYHYLVSYDRLNGRLSHYIDEKEYDSMFVTETGDSGGTVFVPSFAKGDYPSAEIGSGVFGYIDEFRIAWRKFEDLKEITDLASKNYRDLRLIDRNPINREGIITSPVYQFALSGTMVKNFSWSEDLPRDTFIWFEFRTSDALFNADDAHVKWYRINNNQRNIYLQKDGNDFLRGKYYQWRAHLVASPDGKSSPVLSNINLEYELDPPPVVPLMVEIAEAGDGYIILKWKKNVDHDILGYNIYYGVRSGQYEGIIRAVKGKRITNGAGNEVIVRIDNTLVDENRHNDTGGLLDFPSIKNNVLYYFAVTAYDSYKPDTMFNHESDKSREVSARPFGGSEIR